MQCVFGPVVSRRLGLSLGVDLVPFKVCSMDCLYCEVGRTTVKTLVRKEYISAQAIKEEVNKALEKKPTLDYVTFSGYGEPTLSACLGELVEFVKSTGNYRLALLTNGSLLNREDVLEEIKGVDVVLPSLDTVKEETFKRLNRPVEGLHPETIVEGIEKVARETKAKVWIETLFVEGVNDTPDEVSTIGEVIHRLKPHVWHINTVVRPPACSVRGLPESRLREIARFVGYPSTQILGGTASAKGARLTELKEQLYAMVLRRPCPVDELSSALNADLKDIKEAVEMLKEEGKVTETFFGGKPYIKGSF